MPDTVDTAADTAAALLAAAQQGPGDMLRIVLLVSMVGGGLLAWFLLRGYRTGPTDDADSSGGTVSSTGAGAGTGTGTGTGPVGGAERDADA